MKTSHERRIELVKAKRLLAEIESGQRTESDDWWLRGAIYALAWVSDSKGRVPAPSQIVRTK